MLPTSNWYTGAIARRSDHSAKFFHSQNLKLSSVTTIPCKQNRYFQTSAAC